MLDLHRLGPDAATGLAGLLPVVPVALVPPPLPERVLLVAARRLAVAVESGSEAGALLGRGVIILEKKKLIFFLCHLYRVYIHLHAIKSVSACLPGRWHQEMCPAE